MVDCVMKAKPLSPDLDKIEMLPDAWERTERAIKVAVKREPVHRVKTLPAKPAKKPKASTKAR